MFHLQDYLNTLHTYLMEMNTLNNNKNTFIFRSLKFMDYKKWMHTHIFLKRGTRQKVTNNLIEQRLRDQLEEKHNNNTR